jgi:branched-chain amino acid transport system substrate-binding protein
VLYSLNTPDFLSFLLQAQSSKAKIVALANAGQAAIDSVKQAAEFGVVAGGQRLAALLLTAAEVRGLGLETAQGLMLAEAYYWDLNDRTRELGKRFFERTGRMPNMIQAGVYSATLQYLEAVKAAGTKDADVVAKKLKERPVDDAYTSHGRVQANGRMVPDLYLFELKKPSEQRRLGLLQAPCDGAWGHGLSHRSQQRLPIDKVGRTKSTPLALVGWRIPWRAARETRVIRTVCE